MKRLLLAAALLFPIPSMADPTEDAEYIVSQTVTQEMFRGAFAAQRGVIISAIQNDLRQSGINLKKPDRFFDLFIDAFIDEFTDGMRDATVGIYLNQFTEAELADIAAFYRSESGQSLIARTPELMQETALLGQQIGMRAGANAGPRLADRLREEDILAPEDSSLRDRLLDMLE